MTSRLNQHVLVLNRLWQAVNICSVKRALTLLFEGRAQVVLDLGGYYLTFNFNQLHDLSPHSPPDDIISTISFTIRVPKDEALVREYVRVLFGGLLKP